MSETCGGAVLEGDRLVVDRRPLGPATLLGFAPAGFRLAIGLPGQVYCWVPASRCQQGRTAYVVSDGLKALWGSKKYAVAPASRVFASVGDSCKVMIGRFDNRTVEPIVLQHTAEVASVALAADGQIAATVCSGRNSVVSVWDVARQEIVATLMPNYQAPVVAIAPDGRCVAQAGLSGTVQLWYVAHGTHKRCDVPFCASVRSLSFSLDGERLAVGTDSGQVAVVAARSGELLWCQQRHEGFVTSVDFSFDGASLFSGGEDGGLRRLNAANGGEDASVTPSDGVRIRFLTPIPAWDDAVVVAAERGGSYEVRVVSM